MMLSEVEEDINKVWSIYKQLWADCKVVIFLVTLPFVYLTLMHCFILTPILTFYYISLVSGM